MSGTMCCCVFGLTLLTEDGGVVHVHGKGNKDRRIRVEQVLIDEIEVYLDSRAARFPPAPMAGGQPADLAPGRPPPRCSSVWHCHVGGCGRPGRIRGVTTATPSYKGHRYPVEIINHCVWLYFRFPLSFGEVEELMLIRGVAVSYETIRRWCAKFGQAYANQLRRRRPRPGDKWHLDEVFVGINGRLRYVWRAVDQHGNVLDVLVQSRRNAVAAKRFFCKLLKGLRYVPRVLVTDKLGS